MTTTDEIHDPHTVFQWDCDADHPDWWPIENYRTREAAERVVAERNKQILHDASQVLQAEATWNWRIEQQQVKAYNRVHAAAIAAGLVDAHPDVPEPEPVVLTERPSRWSSTWYECRPMEWDG